MTYKILWKNDNGEIEEIETGVESKDEAKRLVSEYALAYHTTAAAFTIKAEREA